MRSPQSPFQQWRCGQALVSTIREKLVFWQVFDEYSLKYVVVNISPEVPWASCPRPNVITDFLGGFLPVWVAGKARATFSTGENYFWVCREWNYLSER